MEKERGTREAMQIGEKVDVGIGCRKRSLGHGYITLGLEVVKLMAEHTTA